MSDTDSFLEEVAEEVRRDKLFGYLKKYGWIAVLIVVLAVGVTGYLEWQRATAQNNAQALGDRVLEALEIEDTQARADALGEIASEAGDAAPVLAIGQAGLLAEAGNAQGAVDALDGVISATDNDTYRQFALLKSVLVGGKILSIEDRQARLDQIASPGQPFWLQAREQQAVLLIEQGNKDGAVELLSDLVLQQGVTNSMQGRVTQMIVSLGGTLPNDAELLSTQ